MSGQEAGSAATALREDAKYLRSFYDEAKWWPIADRIEALADENERLRDLVVRFRQWDDLPGRHDGPFWMREADKVLGDA